MQFDTPGMQNIIKQAIRFDSPLPDGYENRPELFVGLELYFDAFYELASDRQIGMALGPIPWSSMMLFCQVHALDSLQRDLLVHHLTAMDSVFLSNANSKKGSGDGDSS